MTHHLDPEVHARFRDGALHRQLRLAAGFGGEHCAGAKPSSEAASSDSLDKFGEPPDTLAGVCLRCVKVFYSGGNIMARLGLRTLCSVLVAFGSILLVPAASQAVSGSAYTTVGGATAIPGSCFKHPYTVAVTLSPDTYDATLTVDVTGPLGEYVDAELEFMEPSAGLSRQFSYYVFLCDMDRRGTYTITPKIDLYDANYSKTTVTGDASQFAYSNPSEVPLPPQVGPTVTDVDGAVQRVRTHDGRTLKFRLIASPTPAGTVEGKALTWTFKLDNRKSKTVMQGARDKFTYSREFPFHSGLHRVVIWKNGIRVTTLRMRVK